MDQYKRLIKVIGEDNLTKLMNARVLLVGIGGVGGSSLEMLARSGILNITVIDYDKFEITNLNRQILSLYENIGENKVDVARKRVLSINNKCNITWCRWHNCTQHNSNTCYSSKRKIVRKLEYIYSDNKDQCRHCQHQILLYGSFHSSCVF